MTYLTGGTTSSGTTLDEHSMRRFQSSGADGRSRLTEGSVRLVRGLNGTRAPYGRPFARWNPRSQHDHVQEGGHVTAAARSPATAR